MSEMTIQMGFATSIILFCIGLFTIVSKRNLFKTVIGLTLMEGGVLLFLVIVGYIPNAVPPIHPAMAVMTNPLPQAFTLTAIVIGACDIALALALIMKVHRHYGTVDIDKIRGLKG